MYDGYQPVEHSYFVWPDSVEATFSDTGGFMAVEPDGATKTDAYYYQVCYEWTDNQGNLFRSAPSIPVAVTTTGSGTSGSVVLNIPTLRLTYKISSPVRIVVYRWSVANQTYFQVTSITAPIQNDLSVDYITYTDTLADASIVGNNIIYTTGALPRTADYAKALAIQGRLKLAQGQFSNLSRYTPEEAKIYGTVTPDLTGTHFTGQDAAKLGVLQDYNNSSLNTLFQQKGINKKVQTTPSPVKGADNQMYQKDPATGRLTPVKK